MNPDLEFDFYLAQKLGMTVSEMRQRMTPGEWIEWSAYYLKIGQQKQLAAKMRG